MCAFPLNQLKADVVHACDPSTQKAEAGGTQVPSSLAYTKRPYKERRETA
jgi:hypothetical protein